MQRCLGSLRRCSPSLASALALVVSCAPEAEPSSGPAPIEGRFRTPHPGDDPVFAESGPPAVVVDAEPAFSVAFDDGALSLHAGVPGRCGDACDDEDGDALDDDWEAGVLESLRPAVRLHDEEPLLDEGTLGVVGRVAPLASEGDGLRALAVFVLAYSEDFGSACAGVSSHHGDPERVALLLESDGDGLGDVRVAALYTAAHEHTPTDRGQVVDGDALTGEARFVEDPLSGEPRLLVFSSVGKHASYPSPEACEDAFALPCLRERCAALDDGVDLLAPFVNAGEPDAPLVDELEPLGFPGERAWSEEGFCGGLEGEDCTASVREKLLDDPFAAEP